ncbi:MAG: RNA methyltransferase [Betaproteobacteria bacterium RIFCSPLOWO2_02_FULL_62_17]|nr:MAG: RNA methyltransferase [Betaproteobacteria bacterium RIFCSPLOWO2_02_FULL_62_17]
MKAAAFSRRTVLTLGMAAMAAGVFAQQPKFEPQVGQPGKDVVWVPTSQVVVDTMLNLAKVTAKDVVYDLGSGDGRTVITAAKRGARAKGIEYNPDMVELSKQNAAKEGVTDRATFVKADLFETDFSEATVITMFLLPSINLKLRPKILDMKPGTRVASNSFTMGEWQDDETATMDAKDGCTYWCVAHFWIVPAKVQGNWRIGQGELAIKQEFQMLSGSLTADGTSVQIAGRMRGDLITFTAGGAEYSGRVNGNAMEGMRKVGSASAAFSAARQ